MKDRIYDYDVGELNETLKLRISDRKSKKVIFESVDQFIFSEKYLCIETKYENGSRLFGMGQRFNDFELYKGHNYTLWSTDNA